MSRKLQNLMDASRVRLEERLHHFLPLSSEIPASLHQAMRYSSLEQGKRIRPFMVYCGAQLFDISVQRLDRAAVALELIHCYSLVHDDMPAMDNDELRRGKNTCHIQFSEATALLTGDALQTLAFEVLTHDTSNNAEQTLAMCRVLSKASGSRGMAGGQAIDLDSVGKPLNLGQLQTMHQMKTGALISAALEMPCCLVELEESMQQRLLEYAKQLGLSFQIHDDVLDVISDTDTLGKPQGSDEAQDKPTYVQLLGLDQARQMALELSESAIDALASFDEKADPLRWLANYVITRQK